MNSDISNLIQLSVEENFDYPLNQWGAIEFKGPDSERFLNGQLSSDIEALDLGSGHISLRLDAGGRIKFFAYVLKFTKERFVLLVDKKTAEAVQDDLEKFIIMDDVEVTGGGVLNAYLLSSLDAEIGAPVVVMNFQGLPIVFAQEDLGIKSKPLEEETLKLAEFFSGSPVIESESLVGRLVNETQIEKLAVSYTKGCFVGQETAAKLNRGRGPAKFPKLYKSVERDEQLTKDERLLGKISSNNETYYKLFMQTSKNDYSDKFVSSFPSAPLSEIEFSNKLFLRAVDQYHDNNNEDALKKLRASTLYNPKNLEALEIMGNIYGKLNRFDTALEYMERILKQDPNYLMAYTNKSLFLMKQGKIKEAEDAKDKATLLSFGGNVDDIKNREAEREKLKKREKMFRDVLQIDEGDIFALSSLGSILFELGELSECETVLLKAYSVQKDNLDVLCNLVKLYKSKENSAKASEFSVEGLELAMKKGNRKMIDFFNQDNSNTFSV